MYVRQTKGVFLAALLLVSSSAIFAQQSYRLPPQVMVDMVDAPLTPRVSVSPDHQTLLVLELESRPPIADLAAPELRLAGLRINPRRNGPSRGIKAVKLSFLTIADGTMTGVSGLPQGARIEQFRWSADSSSVAFSVVTETETQLWVVKRAGTQARRIEGVSLNATVGSAFSWVSDRSELICLTVPRGRPGPPEAPQVPGGPVIQETSEQKAPARTFQDLLKDSHDEDLFEYYGTSQVMRVGTDGKTTPVGEPALVARAAPSPDGNYLLMQIVERPFSRLVPLFGFAHRVEVWKQDGTLVRELADLPAAEQVPVGRDATREGPRGFVWRADAGATVTWAEARDGGDPDKAAEVRDEVFMLAAPFDGEAVEVAKLGYRFAGIRWGDEGQALVSERWWKTRRLKTWLLDPDSADDESRLLFDLSSEDRYGDPGQPLMDYNDQGRAVLRSAGSDDSLFLSGDGASPQGDRPFLDALDLDTKQTRRLWRSQEPYFEQVVTVLDEEGRVLLTRRESPNEPPNYFVRDVEKNSLRQLTHFPHPTPQLNGVSKELIRYKRADGVDLTATLYLPAGYKPADGPLPMIMWAYPREYKDADAASQVVGSPYEFVRVAPLSPLFWLTQGYAILDGPTMPIVGEGTTEPNDSYVKQLVASAEAAVEEVVKRGVADRHRIAIGGHSYGAFMAANLLAHSDLFRAGIAQSGAYNRTLTPFGFQAEERTFWEAPEVYFAMSPFMHADKVNEPILLVHGMADNNSGTFPIQSERFYGALKGHGATARLVMLPFESHGYAARESILHLLWEKTEWLDRYVKNAKPPESSE